MSEETAIVPHESVQLGTLHVAPDEVVQRATEIATVLSKVILDRKLYIDIRDKKYVRVEGWNTLGAMLGVLPREVEVHELPEGQGYEAKVDLLRVSDGMVIGGASAICTRNENNWRNRDDFAIRSMAITRATGKAFRLGFSWIMKLAGYEPTPAEEMTFVEGKARDVAPAPPATNGNGSLSDHQLDYYKNLAMIEPYNVGPTQFWTVAKHFGIDQEQGQAIYAEVGNWADALIYVVDNYGELEEAK